MLPHASARRGKLGRVTERPAWLAPLVEQIRDAGDDSAAIGAVFARLEADVGAQEAGRRWWAAFAATDASET